VSGFPNETTRRIQEGELGARDEVTNGRDGANAAERVIDMRTALAEHIARTRLATGVRAAADVLKQVGAVIDLPTVAVIHDLSLPYGPSDESGVKLADIFGWPRQYTEHWEKRRNSFHASVLLRCRSERLPFCWRADSVTSASGSDPCDRRPSLKSRRIVRELTELGLCSALVVPMHLPRGRVASVGWWGSLQADRLESLVDESGTSLFVLASHFFEILRRSAMLEPGRGGAATLSAREIECLTLAANGFTDREMAERLRLSAHTVHFHLNNAASKLNARNRIHAVGLAAQLGIIGPVDEAPPRSTDQ
jgi:DNA-binding CsgD family transcriptional regulator